MCFSVSDGMARGVQMEEEAFALFLMFLHSSFSDFTIKLHLVVAVTGSVGYLKFTCTAKENSIN